MATWTKTFPADVAQLRDATAFVESCLEQSSLEMAKQMSVPLALEEVFVNICHYAYPSGPGDIVLTCALEGDAFVLEIMDRGTPFDVLSLPAPDTTLGIDERAIGGLGIHLIREMATSLNYRREDESNFLRLVFENAKE
jgi:anti-sigma regulatory factor (Ser/Thr protein kinase)